MKLRVRGLVGFEDAGNWRKSELKHGVAIAEAQQVLLNDPLCQVASATREVSSAYVPLGVTNEGRRLFVSFAIRRNRVRVISARPMSTKERAIHEAEIANARRG